MYATPELSGQVVTNVIKLRQDEPACMSAATNRASVMPQHEDDKDSFSSPKVRIISGMTMRKAAVKGQNT